MHNKRVQSAVSKIRRRRSEPAAPMKYITDYFWIILIGVTAANAAAWWRYARPHIARKPELRQGYKRLILNFVFWGSIPWLVMGLGLSVGSAASIYDYLKPREANLWVLGWYAT